MSEPTLPIVEKLTRRVPDRSRRPFKSDATVPINPDGPVAADTITALVEALEGIANAVRLGSEFDAQAWANLSEAMRGTARAALSKARSA